MDSKKFALPLWRYKRKVDRSELERRILHDALAWGLGDLPQPEDLPDFWQDIYSGENIFHRVPRMRPIETFRLIPENLAELKAGKKEIACFLFRPWRQVISDSDLVKLDRDTILDKIWDTALSFKEIPFPCIKELTFERFIEHSDLTYKIRKKRDTLSNFIRDTELSEYLDEANKDIQYIKHFCISSPLSTYLFGLGLDQLKSKESVKNTDSETFSLKYIIQYVKVTCNKPPFAKPLAIRPAVKDLLETDIRRLRLPSPGGSQVSDKARGLWDAWWPEDEIPDKRWYVAAELAESCVARDPWQDVQEDAVVCIDFGASSTTAAVREADNSVRLLRLDAFDPEGAPTDGRDPYENPTCLEFSDVGEALNAWRNEPWRPLVEWKHVKCARLARDELRRGARAESGLTTIKTWARALPDSCPTWLRDETGKAFELSPLPPENDEDDPGDFATRPLDPVELYAFFLGVALNNQAFFGGRIYRDYFMTFPVKFPVEVRRRILQGFRRGLLRSMPHTFGVSRRWLEEKPFRLGERASEPAAFAAGVLPWLGVEPTEAGEPFAVFDFGGGATDFAFGLWRLPTPEERLNEPWERVLDILDASGDENLGGEHLLEALAYELLRSSPANRENCAAARVTFSPPREEALFEGSELLLASNPEARANTVTLCEYLRPLWEEDRLPDDETGVWEANLLDREGKTVGVTLTVDKDVLRDCLRKRILKGVRAFFAAFGQAFKTHGVRPRKLHVLLAGNSCRSSLTREAFDVCLDEIVPNERESVIIHDEMLPGGAKAAASSETLPDGGVPPTLKTGVALGLLRLLPGEATGLVERNRQDEAPFFHTAGIFENNILKPILPRNAEYGRWRLAGRVFREGVFLLGYTLSPEALELRCPRSACRQLRLDLGEENFGKYLFVKAVAPGKIATALGTDADGAPDEASVRVFTLKG